MITLTDTCRPDVRRALHTDPRVLLVGRSAGPYGARALDLCVSGIYNAADSLAVREGIDARHLLPADPQALVAHHRTAAVIERIETSGGAAVHRWSLWSPPGTPELTVLLSTGSAFAVTTDGQDQPALRRVSQIVEERRPSVVYAQSMSRFSRGPLGLLVDVLHGIGETRADGPFLGDEMTGLAQPDLGLRMHLAVQAAIYAADYRQLVAQPRLPNGRFAGRRTGAGAAAGGGAR